jgi:hypothetical protein
MPKMPVTALRTERLNAVGDTGSRAPMAASMPVVRASSPWRDANTMRSGSSSDPAQSYAA